MATARHPETADSMEAWRFPEHKRPPNQATTHCSSSFNNYACHRAMYKEAKLLDVINMRRYNLSELSPKVSCK